MNMINFIAPVLGAALMIGAASAEPVGTVSNVEGDVFALRGNDTVVLTSGDELLVNDRIIARDEASAMVSAFGCDSSLSSGAIITVNDAMCAAYPVSFGFAQGSEVAAANLFITAALVSAPAIIGFAISESDDDTPASP